MTGLTAPCVEDQASPEGRLMNRRLLTALGASVLLVAASLPMATTAAQPSKDGKPVAVQTNRDKAKSKIHPKLLRQMESGSNKTI